MPESEFGVMCLEVEVGQRIERGYTIRRMVAMTPEATDASGMLRQLLVALIAGIVALLAIWQRT